MESLAGKVCHFFKHCMKDDAKSLDLQRLFLQLLSVQGHTTPQAMVQAAECILSQRKAIDHLVSARPEGLREPCEDRKGRERAKGSITKIVDRFCKVAAAAQVAKTPWEVERLLAPVS